MNAKGPQNGWTPLHICAGYGHLEVTRALIEAGADLFHLGEPSPKDS